MCIRDRALSAEEKRRPVNKLRFSLLAKMSIALLGFGWDDITIAYVSEGNERYEGKTVAQIAREMGKNDIDAMRTSGRAMRAAKR